MVGPCGWAGDVAEGVSLQQFLTGQPGEQVADLGGKFVGGLGGVGVERVGGAAITAGGTAKADVDTAGGNGFEDAKLLRHFEGGVVGAA